jgi:chemotaxis protein MotB
MRLVQLLACITIISVSGCGTNKKLEAAQGEAEALREKNQQLEQSINSLKNELNKAKSDATAAASKTTAVTNEYNAYKQKCAETEEALKETQAVLQAEYEMLQEIEDRIEAAMEDFAEKGVDVYYEDGLVHITLPEDLMYKSGSAALGADGKKALGSLAAVLKDYPRLNLVVVGHTDDVKFKKGSMDNLSLSTERANGVVRTLVGDYQIDPTRLTAAGKGKYLPVADNGTAEGRAKNRRTDIVLNPNLEKLWGSLRK